MNTDTRDVPVPQYHVPTCAVEIVEDDECTHEASRERSPLPPAPPPPAASSTAADDDSSSEHARHPQQSYAEGGMPTFAARIFSNRQIVSVLSDLIAILEHIKYEDRGSGKRVFNTKWARNLFQMSLSAEMKKDFDVEEWYSFIASKNPAKRVNEFTGTIDSALYNADIQTDWVVPLIHLENMSSGFITMFHGVLSLEKQSHMKMNQYVKLDCHADTYGLETKTDETGKDFGGGKPNGTANTSRIQFIGWH